MKKFYIVFYAVLTLVIAIAMFAMLIPFIYENRVFVAFTLAYPLLAVCFSFHLIYGFNYTKSTAVWLRKNKVRSCFIFFLTPLVGGFILTFLQPVAVDIFSSDIVLRKYKLLKIEQHGRDKKDMSRVYATDRDGKEINYLISNHILRKADLQDGKTFYVRGRDSFGGLVIDKVNGVQR